MIIYIEKETPPKSVTPKVQVTCYLVIPGRGARQDIKAGNTWVSALTLHKLSKTFDIEPYELLKPEYNIPLLSAFLICYLLFAHCNYKKPSCSRKRVIDFSRQKI
jgi:hypothetical protein